MTKARKLASTAVATAFAVGGLLAAPQMAQAAGTVSPAACPGAIKHKGSISFVGTLPQERWTETISNNCASVRVRAVVICENNATGGDSTNYGGVFNGNGKSYYTCNAISHVDHGYAQYYNGIKWLKI